MLVASRGFGIGHSLLKPNCYPLQSFQFHRGLLTLAIETSCDDTAVAVLERKGYHHGCDHKESNRNASTTSVAGSRTNITRLLFNKRVTTKNHGWGGIHPLDALDNHQNNLAKLVSEAIESLPNIGVDASEDNGGLPTRVHSRRDGISKRLPDFVSVTRGPGMRTNLNCGLDMAKGLATAWQIPLVGVHHMQAHALSVELSQAIFPNPNESDVTYPMLTLLISGGHTMLLHSKGLIDHEILATTADIAIGDALDKCGRLVLPPRILSAMTDHAYARELSNFAFPHPNDWKDWDIPKTRAEELAKPNNNLGWSLRAPLAESRDLRFSFGSVESSLKRRIAEWESHLNKTITDDMSDDDRRIFARTAMTTCFEHIASRTTLALEGLSKIKNRTPTTSLVLSGGVAANEYLAGYMRLFLDNRGFEHVNVLTPKAELCTDNAAMIAWCGLEMFEAGYQSDLSISSIQKWSMDPKIGGGILGITGWIV